VSTCASLGSVVAGRWAAIILRSLLCIAASTGCRPQATPTLGPSASPAPDAETPYVAPPPSAPTESQSVTWTCAASLCPWGASLSGQAAVWPAAVRASDTRLGYTVSAGIYLAAARANGIILAIDRGTARAYAGLPGTTEHRLLAKIEAGHTLHIEHLGDGEVLSVQADTPFTYRTTPALPSKTEPAIPAPHSEVIQATRALWRCNAPDCAGGDWTGAVIAWPVWAAHQSNGRRTGDQSRSVFSTDGAPLHPYMGSWAHGCKVTGESGTVQIIEWQRGADAWRSTWLQPGQSHVIRLVSPEDGAMIETYEGSPGFSVSLTNCTPQRIQS
jgi:hypothetical protein